MSHPRMLSRAHATPPGARHVLGSGNGFHGITQRWTDHAKAPLKAVMFLLACCLTAWNPQTAQATAPAGFSESRYVTGLASPTQMEFAPDGRLFVSEQGGTLRIIKNGVLVSTPALTLTVDNRGERGLLGIAFDPNFASNQYIYLYYTATTPAAHNRVSRFTLSGDTVVAGSEFVVLDLPDLSAAQNHNGGGIRFGPDGKLFIAVGENATPSNSQSMTTLLGKLLRLNPDGTIPTDNPFYNTATSIYRAIWALGLRNPYTMAFQPGTGVLYINDVGQSTWEEINQGVAGANYGWPTCEGNCAGGFINPVYAYGHSSGTPTGIAITGGSFYNPSTVQFPPGYVGNYFFADYNGWIGMIEPSNGFKVTVFATALGSTVDVKIGPDGKLYHLTRSSGSVYVIKSDGGTPPTITQNPSDVTVHQGESATFSVIASGVGPFTYQWQRNGSNISGATSASYTLANATVADNNSTFRCVVSNAFGSTTSSSATLIFSQDQPPTVSIVQPVTGQLYSALETIAYSATANDNEDGVLPASAFSWTIVFHHDTHTHPFLGPLTGASSGTFQIPNVGETSDNVWYRVMVTVTDSSGQTASQFVDVVPRKVTLRLDSVPSGLQLLLDGQPVTTPYTFLGVVGVLRNIAAVQSQTMLGQSYDFASWSQGGALVQDIATPTVNTTYTATFNAATNTAVVTTLLTNATSLTIPTSGTASTYPSKITVAGVSGSLNRLTVRLNNLAHTYPDDLDVLLVGPGGQSVVLMSDAGGSYDVNGVNLTFDDLGSTGLTDEGQISAGTFKPVNYEGADTYPAPAPTGTPGTSLAAFNGTSPNGIWSLYVVDGYNGDAGSIAGGWSLSLTTTAVGPTISDIANQVIQEDASTSAIAFTLADPDTAAESLTVTASSSNTAVAPLDRIVFSGTGATRTVTVTPPANAFGSANITVTVSDGTLSSSKSFTLTVLPVNDLPTLSAVQDVAVTVGSVVAPISLTVGDQETVASALQVTATSSNTQLVPAAGLAVSGTGTSRSLTVTPTADATGWTTITLTVSDETGAQASTNFRLDVLPNVGVRLQFTNSASITLNTAGIATPYGSTLAVSSAPTAIGKVRVTLYGFTHTYPDDVDMLLVGPQGQSVLLMSDCGGSADVNKASLTFSDDAASSLPDEAAFSGDTCKPTNIDSSDTFTSPAPAGPYGASLSVFSGTNPNGTWTLYITDDYAADGGAITGGWALSFDTVNTAPVLSDIPAQTVTLPNTLPTIPVAVSDAETSAELLTINSTSSNQALLPNAGIVCQGTGTNRTLSLTPATGATGSSTVLVTVSDAGGMTTTKSFTVTINPAVQDPPTTVTNTYRFTGAITIADNAPANPYPASIQVSGATLSLSEVQVTIQGISHTYPDDVDMVLVAPNGARLVLISDAGGSADWVNLNLTLDDKASIAIPDNTGVSSGSYKPADYTTGDIPAQVPAGTTLTTLGGFAGINPNGVWSLYVVDDATDDLGSISGGWSITLVGPVPPAATNTAPTISTISNQTVAFNSSGVALPFTVGDLETPASSLVVSAESSNVSVVAANGLVLSGTDVNRTLTVTPKSGQSGSTTITLRVTDAEGLFQTSTFLFTVQPQPTSFTFANTTTFTIPSSGKASLYPSTITVSGITGTLTKLEITLDGLTHTYPDDLDMLLVSPTGQKVVILSDVGGAVDVNNIVVVISDLASNSMPDETALSSGTYKPTNIAATESFAAPAPASPYGTALTNFFGSSPNGVWSLYVLDDSGSDLGNLARGWSMTLSSTGTPIVADPGNETDPTPSNNEVVTDPIVWIKSIQYSTPAQAVIELDGQPEKPYQLEWSVDLKNWEPVQSSQFSPENNRLILPANPNGALFFRIR